MNSHLLRWSARAILAASLSALALPTMAGWEYQNSTDKMTGKAQRFAQVQSTNSLELGFPYSGRNMGQLIVRQHPKYGLDAIVTVDKGQILCNAFDSCTIQVKFDTAPPVRFMAAPAADHDSKVIFLRDARRFITQAQKAKSILVQIQLFQNGDQVLEFATPAPLTWDAKSK